MTVVRLSISGLLLEFASLLHQIGRISLPTTAVVVVSIATSNLLAALRLQGIASDAGVALTFRDAMASVSAGALGGALFFQTAGQLIARGTLLSRHGVPFASTVAITAYERAVAAAVSFTLAAIGALAIFGRIWIDIDTGGASLIKLAIGLVAVTVAGCAVAYGRLAVLAIAPRLTRTACLRFLRSASLSLAVQLAMMFAYVSAAKSLSTETPLPDLAAAAALVMFAASVPISLAGWGIREMSAVAALGAIGVATGNALVVAIMIGTVSLLVMVCLALLSARSWIVATPSTLAASGDAGINFTAVLAWCIPLVGASLVLFQVHLPLAAGALNVNLADPFALLGGTLFVLSLRQMPSWRIAWLNAALVAATGVLTLSLLIGAANFGWTSWAVLNKWLGWFVLLAYGATGALLVKQASHEGFRLLLLTFAVALCAVTALDLALVFARSAGVSIPVSILEHRIKGFSQNANAFAFQALIALVIILALDMPERLRTLLAALALSAIWFSSSRSAWLALVVVLGVLAWLGPLPKRNFAIAACMAAGIAVTTVGLSWLQSTSAYGPTAFSPASSTAERLKSLIGGWELFAGNPLLGAGLGAFINSEVASGSAPLVIHSTPLWLLAETGLVGFLVFAATAAHAVAIEWRQPEVPARVVVLVLLAFGTMSLVHELLYQRTMWLVLGAAFAAQPAVVARTAAGSS